MLASRRQCAKGSGGFDIISFRGLRKIFNDQMSIIVWSLFPLHLYVFQIATHNGIIMKKLLVAITKFH